MDYIVHRRLRRTAICGDVNLPYGTVLEEAEGYLYYDGMPICAARSQTAKEYIAWNGDGRGLERGKLTYAIAFRGADRPGCRFDPKQREIICEKYSRYLRPEHDVILFNDEFFMADIEALTEMARDLHIRP